MLRTAGIWPREYHGGASSAAGALEVAPVQRVTRQETVLCYLL